MGSAFHREVQFKNDLEPPAVTLGPDVDTEAPASTCLRQRDLYSSEPQDQCDSPMADILKKYKKQPSTKQSHVVIQPSPQSDNVAEEDEDDSDDRDNLRKPQVGLIHLRQCGAQT